MAAVRQLLWDGMIPVELTMDPAELAALGVPQPLYCMVPRMGYLSVASADAISHFTTFAAAVGPQQEVWFETLDTRCPLKWYMPFGVLFDLLGRGAELPWKIVVHFRGFPSQQLPHYEGVDSVEKFFRQRFKQAMHLQHGSGNEALGIAKACQMEIWEGIRTNNAVLYHKALASVVSSSPRLIPVRIHVDTEPPIHPAVTALRDDGTARTLHDVLASCHPRLVDPAEPLCVRCQGVMAPLHAPVFDMWKTLRHPDLYLYITIVTVAEESRDDQAVSLEEIK